MENSCENCKYVFEDSKGTHCSSCIHNAKDHFEPMTYADWLRSMSDEELANWLAETTKASKLGMENHHKWNEWLKSKRGV